MARIPVRYFETRARVLKASRTAGLVRTGMLVQGFLLGLAGYRRGSAYLLVLAGWLFDGDVDS